MEDNRKIKTYKIIMLAILVAFITFIITSIGMYELMFSPSNDSISKTIENYRNLIDEYYLGDIDEEKLKEGAVKGYIEGLNDPYTEYISKDDMKEYMEDTLGNFVGIGIYMVKDTETNKIKVLAPIENSPAQKEGILAGDLILAVDGVAYSGDDLSIVSSKIKGEEGSTVKLEIFRDNKTLNFEVKRENIKMNPVNGKVLENQIGYIQFSSFDDGTADEFKAKFEELEKQGIESLIIDLRNNGGGIVSEALQIADYIADKDSVLLYEVDKNNKEEIKKSDNDPIIKIPVIVLTNGNTASSSEILAGALKDLGKAKVVGTKTYGKGVIQQIIELKDGSGLKITTQKYLTPNKTEINKVGIEPNEVVELPDTVENELLVKKDEDTQLQKAVEMLKQ